MAKQRNGLGRTAPAAAVAALLLGAAPPAAADVEDLDLDMPFTLEDAHAARRGSVELQGAARFDRFGRRGDPVRLLPRLQLGVAEGLQADVALPYSAGSGREADQGSLQIGVRRELTRERGRWFPDLAVAGDAGLPVGPGDRGPELRLTGIASRTVDQASRTRLHLNLAWFRRLDPAEDERRERWRLAVGMSRPVARDAVLVANLLRESQERGEQAANILEGGLRWAPARDVILGAALGTGLGRDSPRFRAVLSVQISLRGG